MAINATSSGTTRELIPAGNYVARCYQMIEIGHITEVVMGTPKRLHKVRIGWELPDETRVFDPAKGEQPLVISKEYTLSLHEKSNLRMDLKSWRGKDFTEEEAKCFDITKLIGVPCMLNIIHRPSKSDPSRVYEQISGITPLPKSVKCAEAVNPPLILSYDNFDPAVFNSLPDFLKQKIQSSEEYAALQSPQSRTIDEPENIGEEDEIDALPF